MSLAARKSDVRSHLSRPVKRHYLSPGSTNLPEKMIAAVEGNSDKRNTSTLDDDFEHQPSSAGVYAPNTVKARQ